MYDEHLHLFCVHIYLIYSQPKETHTQTAIYIEWARLHAQKEKANSVSA